MSFRDRFFTRQTAEAITAPPAIVLAGAGAAAAILAGAPQAVTAAAGAAAYTAWVAWRMPRPARKPVEDIDLRRLNNPWRRYVQEALDARERFERSLGGLGGGPLRERLAAIGQRMEDGVAECWRIATRGQQLEEALAQLASDDEINVRIRELEAEPPSATNERLVAALRSQADTFRRIVRTAEAARERLQVLEARLDEIVARALELALRVDDPNELGDLGDDVDTLVSEMEALRRGLDETAGQTAVG